MQLRREMELDTEMGQDHTNCLGHENVSGT